MLFQNLPSKWQVTRQPITSTTPNMTTFQSLPAGLDHSTQPFLARAFAAPLSQQSISDYPPLALFAAAEQVQEQSLQSATPPLKLNGNPKLPSLEGLLKQMQTTSPTASVVPYPQHPRVSPVSRQLSSMPALRTVISPTMTKRMIPVKPTVQTPLPGVASFAPQTYPQISSSMGPSFPGKKRTWADAITVQPLVCPSTFRASPCSQSTHRSRASKYCRIEGCERVSQRNNLCHSHGGKRLCKKEGCSSKDRGNGFCIKHGGGKICSMAGCEKKARRKGLCTQHFRNIDEPVSSPYMTKPSAYRSV